MAPRRQGTFHARQTSETIGIDLFVQSYTSRAPPPPPTATTTKNEIVHGDKGNHFLRSANSADLGLNRCSNRMWFSGANERQARRTFSIAYRCLYKALMTGVPGGTIGALSM
mmetsp:Transcript_1975/g.3514  ORF Transcript_1975/g.3514 Transcript_1975/m.3514 type:complete len:112 (+) Transcript_1975:143-478(+)